MKMYCYIFDLKDDLVFIVEYECYYEVVWLEIFDSIIGSGIWYMIIYCWFNCLCMIMEIEDDFDLVKKVCFDVANFKV